MDNRTWQSKTARAVCQKTGLSDPVQGAILLAEQCTAEYEVSYAAQRLDYLASCLDARIARSDMKEAGQLIPIFDEKSDFLIMVNQADTLRRQYFSICHEFGHLLMPNYDPFHGNRVDWETMKWNRKEEEEYLCDTAAAEILMPRRIFKPRLRGCGLNIEALDQLAEEFEVSLEATAVNIVRAGIGDVAVIVWEKGFNKVEESKAQNLSLFADEFASPVEKKYRVKFACSHGRMSEFFFPVSKSIENDSLIARTADSLADGIDKPYLHGTQCIHCKHGKVDAKLDFYVECCAYWTRKEGEMVPKVISLVFLNEPITDDLLIWN